MITCSLYLQVRNIKNLAFLQILATSLIKPMNGGPVLKYHCKFTTAFDDVLDNRSVSRSALISCNVYNSLIELDNCCVVIT